MKNLFGKIRRAVAWRLSMATHYAKQTRRILQENNIFSGGRRIWPKKYMSMRQDLENSIFWDEEWYLNEYFTDFITHKSNFSDYVTPIDYYMRKGWKLGHKPSPLFRVTPPARLRINPLSHFLNRQIYEGYHFDENIWFPSEERVAAYLRQKVSRKAEGVVYTCITGGYDSLIQHYFISDAWDYVCFSDDPALVEQGQEGIWEVRPLAGESATPSRANRWHKVNPHKLFPAYGQSLYIDGNINILSSYLFDLVRERNARLAMPRHFGRACAYDEIDELLRSPRFDDATKQTLRRQKLFLESVGFPRGFGLTENNVLYRRHRDASVAALMDNWWETIERFSHRDQASLCYVLWKNQIDPRSVTFTNVRQKYRDFWIVRHTETAAGAPAIAITDKLRPAFDRDIVPVVMSCNESFVAYLGVLLNSIAAASSAGQNYDIIVLESELSEGSKSTIRAMLDNRSNFSVRFYNMSPALRQLGSIELHIEGYVPLETYNKIFLADILEGYGKILYIDTDLVVVRDLGELLDTELWGHPIAASLNLANIHAARTGKTIKGRHFGRYLTDELGVEDHGRYFQAGVLLLDLGHPRLETLLAQAIAKLRKIREPIFFDQCIFNSMFYGDVRFVSTKWNHVWYLQDYSYLKATVGRETFFDYARSRNDPAIIHYASKDKPTSKGGWQLSAPFWRNARETPYHDEIAATVSPEVRREYGALAGVIDGADLAPVPRLLVHLHLYYLNQLDYMREKLANVGGVDATIVITAPSRAGEIRATMRNLVAEPDILTVGNAGYDVLPFLQTLRRQRLSQFDYLLKIHTKAPRDAQRGTVYGERVSGHAWRDELIDALIGSPEIFQHNIARLEADRTLGGVAAGRFLFSTRENNEEAVYNLHRWRSRFGLGAGARYVGGTMFLCRAFPFERFTDIRDIEADFTRGSTKSGEHKNLAHVFERLFGLAVENEGLRLEDGAQPARRAAIAEASAHPTREVRGPSPDLAV